MGSVGPVGPVGLVDHMVQEGQAVPMVLEVPEVPEVLVALEVLEVPQLPAFLEHQVVLGDPADLWVPVVLVGWAGRVVLVGQAVRLLPAFPVPLEALVGHMVLGVLEDPVGWMVPVDLWVPVVQAAQAAQAAQAGQGGQVVLVDREVLLSVGFLVLQTLLEDLVDLTAPVVLTAPEVQEVRLVPLAKGLHLDLEVLYSMYLHPQEFYQLHLLYLLGYLVVPVVPVALEGQAVLVAYTVPMVS